MGDQNVELQTTTDELTSFTRAAVRDLEALTAMLKGGRVEVDAVRIGVEQEMFLVDEHARPAKLAPRVVEDAQDTRLTTEIGLFNLEANLPPVAFEGQCLRDLDLALREVLNSASSAAAAHGARPLLAGILPSLRRSDLAAENITPSARYRRLDEALRKSRGGPFAVRIAGVDDLEFESQTFGIEAANCSFQVHYQPPLPQIIAAYNWAQMVAGAVLAASVNSPILLGRRLWQETRIALFQHSVDERAQHLRQRGTPFRAGFGESWLRGSVVELFTNDLARFKVLATSPLQEDSRAVVAGGGTPRLDALGLHTGTIWRWNRVCYGISNGAPGLRIENRMLPSGPTIADEVANAALLLGLLVALPQRYGDPADLAHFDTAKSNFLAAAQYGLACQLGWVDGEVYSAKELILGTLLPLARQGLESRDCSRTDVDKYLGIVEQRVSSGRNGSRWQLDALELSPAVDSHALAQQLLHNQGQGLPVHEWAAAVPLQQASPALTAEDVMHRDIVTVRPEDPIELPEWLADQGLGSIFPVETEEGHLVGVVKLPVSDTDSRDVLRVQDVLSAPAVTVEPRTPLRLVREMARQYASEFILVAEHGHLCGAVFSPPTYSN